MIPLETKDCKKNVRKPIVCRKKSCYTVLIRYCVVLCESKGVVKQQKRLSQELEKEKGWIEMNSEDRKKLRKQKHRIMMMRLWLPVALVVVLIAGLTAGGIALSLGQTKSVAEQGETKEADTKEASNESKSDDSDGDKSQNQDQENQTGESNSEAQTEAAGTGENAEPQTGAESDPSGNDNANQPEDGNYSVEQADFDEFITNLDEAVAANADYLKLGSENLTVTLAELKTYDRTHLTETQAKTYDAVLDALNDEIEGEQYASVAAAANGAALCSVEGGVDYYNYILQKYSGIDGTWETFRSTLADEANANHDAMVSLQAADSSLQMVVASFTKNAPDTEYAYDTVTASSSALKKNLACSGFTDGWTEFGIIRAYLNDERFDDAMKQYLIASTRMTYALYGVADISVHAGGWGEAEVIDLCNQYFGEASTDEYGTSVYNMVVTNPGRYAAASLDYLQITEIEATMAAQQGEDYSEANLLDLLFNQGPADFRVLRSWVGLQ